MSLTDDVRPRMAAVVRDWWDEQDAITMLGSTARSERAVSMPPRSGVTANRFLLNVFMLNVSQQLLLPHGAVCLDWSARYLPMFPGCAHKFDFKYSGTRRVFRRSFNQSSRGNIVGDLANISHVPSGLLDLAIVTQVFEHVPHFWTATREISRLLKPGGVLLFTVPFSYAFHPSPGDFWRFSPMAVVHLLESSGFVRRTTPASKAAHCPTNILTRKSTHPRTKYPWNAPPDSMMLTRTL